jgi:membrane protease YdiL (CAAX protease family)
MIVAGCGEEALFRGFLFESVSKLSDTDTAALSVKLD